MNQLSGIHLITPSAGSHSRAYFKLNSAQQQQFSDVAERSVVSVPQQPFVALRQAYQEATTPAAFKNMLGLSLVAGGAVYASTHSSLGLLQGGFAGVAATAFYALAAPYHTAKERMDSIAEAHRHFEYQQFQYIEHLRTEAVIQAAHNLVASANRNIAAGCIVDLDTLGKLVRFDDETLEGACDKLQISVLQIRHALDRQAGILAIDGPNTYYSIGLDPKNPEHEPMLLESLTYAEHEKSWDIRATETAHAEKPLRCYAQSERYKAPVLEQAEMLSLRRNFHLAYSHDAQIVPPLTVPPREITLSPFHGIDRLAERIAAFEDTDVRLDLPALRL